MTTAPASAPKPKAAKSTLVGAPTEELARYCPRCIGHGTVWCPWCCGFAGCETCQQTGMLPCPACTGGPDVPVIMW